ncbi:MAG: hypothetical protein HY541_03315 [Deltaproteobacteria bacterium]|nr:hypothetical protein [Deltaproteobacteria bacterium]
MKANPLQILLPYRLNQNKQREVFEWLTDLSKRDGRPVEEILDTAIKLIPSNIQEAKRGDALREILRDQRYPRYQKRKKEFDAKVKKSGFPAKIQIHPHPWFEEEGFEIRGKVTSEEEKDQLIRALQKMTVRDDT